MITELKNIANQITNQRMRLLSILQQGEQVKDDISTVSKCLEGIESHFRNLVSELEDKLNELSA